MTTWNYISTFYELCSLYASFTRTYFTLSLGFWWLNLVGYTSCIIPLHLTKKGWEVGDLIIFAHLPEIRTTNRLYRFGDFIPSKQTLNFFPCMKGRYQRRFLQRIKLFDFLVLLKCVMSLWFVRNRLRVEVTGSTFVECNACEMFWIRFRFRTSIYDLKKMSWIAKWLIADIIII